MDRNILRRQALFDDATHFIFRDRRQGRVVAVKEREPNIFVADEQRGTSILRIALAKTEDAFVGTLARDNLFKTKTEVFVFVAFDLEFPVLAAAFAHFDR